VKQSEGKPMIVIEKGSPEGSTEIIRQETELKNLDTLELKIEARGKFYDFYYRTPNTDWELLLNDVDGTYLSTEVAGGFVGAILGMYAYSPE
jgi:alpha-N-arabinofuranosidase